MIIVQEYQPMTDDPVEAKLDILVDSAMEPRGEAGQARGAIIQTQWLTCIICVVAVLAAAAIVFTSMPA
jgi:hypothetical protein